MCTGIMAAVQAEENTSRLNTPSVSVLTSDASANCRFRDCAAKVRPLLSVTECGTTPTPHDTHARTGEAKAELSEEHSAPSIDSNT
jgi:hypothetical protein